MQNQIPNNWQKVKLGEFADVKGGKRLPMGFSVQDKKTDHPYLRIVDMNEAGLDISEIKYISDEVFKRISQYTISDKDLYISIVGTIGFVGKIPQFLLGANLTENCAKICNFSEDLDRDFLLYFLKSYKGKAEIKSGTGGSSQPKLALHRIENFQLLLPPVEIQKQIVSILSAFDDKIELNNKIAKTLEEIAQVLFKEWFVKFKFPGHEKIKMGDSPLGKIPEGWNVKKLEDVCSRITDGSHWSPKTVEIGHPMASVKDMNKWGFDLTKCRKISEGDYAKLVKSDCKPRTNDILIAKDGSYLKHVFIASKDIDLVILSSIAILRPNEELLPELLRLYLLEPNIKSRMKSYVSGAALPRIILQSFRKFLIIVPPSSIQQQFYNIVFSGVKLRNNLLETNIKLIHTRDLLLPKLMKGEIRVTN